MTTSVGVVGFRGYSGAELVRILARHANVEPVLLEHRSDPPAEIAPRGGNGRKRIQCTPEAVAAENLQAVFLATPPKCLWI